MWRESQAIKRPVDGRGGERGQAPERLGRPEPQQKVQESPRRLRIEGLEKGAPPRPSRASSARSELGCFDRFCYDALRLLCLKQDRKLYSFA